jgi:hypothetical protein
VIVTSGRLNGEKILADRFMTPDEFVKQSISQLHVLLENPLDEEKLVRLRDLFLQNGGKCSVFLHVPELEAVSRVVRVSAFLLVEPCDDLIEKIRLEGLALRAWVG